MIETHSTCLTFRESFGNGGSPGIQNSDTLQRPPGACSTPQPKRSRATCGGFRPEPVPSTRFSTKTAGSWPKTRRQSMRAQARKRSEVDPQIVAEMQRALDAELKGKPK